MSESPLNRRKPMAVGGVLWLAAILVHPVISVVLGGLCLLLAWTWLGMPVDSTPGRRHPHLRKVARRPKVIIWRARDAWLPASRDPKLWGLVLGGLLGLGAGLSVLTGDVWWIPFTPLLVMGAALLVDVMIIIAVGLWPIALMMLAMVATVPFTFEGAGLRMLIGLVVGLLGLWLADLARALQQQRPKV